MSTKILAGYMGQVGSDPEWLRKGQGEVNFFREMHEGNFVFPAHRPGKREMEILSLGKCVCFRGFYRGDAPTQGRMARILVWQRLATAGERQGGKGKRARGNV
jgi:hypothetical protein